MIQITILNMIIAIMGDTFENVMETRSQAAYKERIDIISDWVWITQIDNSDKKKYAFLVTNSTKSAYNDHWEGSINRIENVVKQMQY